MRKLDAFFILLFLLSIWLGFSLGTFQRVVQGVGFSLPGSGGYLIVVPDAWASDSTIQSFANYKRNQGYTVQTVGLSTIYNTIPSGTPAYPPLYARQITGSTASADTWFLFRSGSSYQLFGHNRATGSSDFIPAGASSSDVPVLIHAPTYTLYTSFTVTYVDAGGSHTLAVHASDIQRTSALGMWGDFAIRADGQGFVLMPDDAWRVAQYIESQASLKYVLFVGNSLVPSFQGKWLTEADGMWYSRTDAPYRASTLHSGDAALDSKFSVGRIPFDDLATVHSVLQRTIGFTIFSAKRFEALMGPPMDWAPFFESVANTAWTSLKTLDPNVVALSSELVPSESLLTYLNTEKDFLLLWGHGNPSILDLSALLTTSMVSQMSVSKPSIVWIMGCDTGDPTASDFLASTFLKYSGADSIAVVAPSLPVLSEATYPKAFFTNLATHTTGEAFTVGSYDYIQDYFSYQYYGDPAITVSYSVAPPPSPSPSPSSSPSPSPTPSPGPSGTLQIESNVECVVTVDPIGYSCVTPFQKSVPSGSYTLTARIYDGFGKIFAMQQWSVTVQSGAYAHTFFFQSQPSSGGLEWYDYATLFGVILAVIYFMVRLSV